MASTATNKHRAPRVFEIFGYVEGVVGEGRGEGLLDNALVAGVRFEARNMLKYGAATSTFYNLHANRDARQSIIIFWGRGGDKTPGPNAGIVRKHTVSYARLRVAANRAV